MSGYEQLIAKAAAGDKAAFEEIYRRTNRKVYFTCISFLKNEHDAADVSQEVYITIMKNLASLEDTSGFEGWVSRVTVNKCKDFLKKKKPVPVEDETLSGLIDGGEQELLLPEDYVINEAKRKILRDILRENLSDILYQTVVLFYFHDMSAAEIAQMMDCPVGTVTSRLCIARAKIKKGVQNYEEKNGDKLYSTALIPILAAILTAEANAMEPVDVWADVASATSQTMNTAQGATTSGGASGGASSSGSATQAAVSGGISGAMKTAGGKTMLSTLKGKIIAAVLAAVVVVGGVATVAVVTSDDSNKDSDKRVESEAGGDESDKGSGKGDKSDEDALKDLAERLEAEKAEEERLLKQAQQIRSDLDNYCTALKNGDVETLLEWTDPNSEFGMFLAAAQQYDWTGDMIEALFSNMEWEIFSEFEDTMVISLRSAEKDTREYISFASQFGYSMVSNNFMSEEYLYLHPEGTIVRDDMTVESNSEAIEILDRIMEAYELNYGTGMEMTVPDENGKYYFTPSTITSVADLDYEDVEDWGEDFPMEYVCWHAEDSHNRDIYVGDAGTEYAFFDEEIEKALSYIEKKDFVGFEAYLESLDGKDYSEEWGATYGRYEDLTEAQKAWVKDYVDKHIEIVTYRCALVKDGTPFQTVGSTRVSSVNITRNWDEKNQWLLDNNVMMEEFTSFYYEETIEELANGLNDMLLPYYRAIKYATYMVE